MPRLTSILDAIGHTPLIPLSRIGRGLQATLLAKVESLNPGGSVKDRIAVAMLDEAEREGRIRPGDTLVEATAGNTGVGLALAAAVRGYRCVFVLPEKMSREKEALLRAYGAEVIRTPNAPPDHPDNMMQVARRLADENGWHLPEQFSNPANPAIHYATTGPEIWEDSGGHVDVFVCGVGTGGTLSGTGRFLKDRNPALRLVLADPVGSRLSGGPEGPYLVEGIGGSRAPANFDASLVDEAIAVPDGESFEMARRLAREEGILAGGSSGCAAAAAMRVAARREMAGKTLVVLIADTGANYLSRIFREEA